MFSAGILEQSMGARNRVGVGLSFWPAKDGIFKLLRSPGIDSGIDSGNLCRLEGRYDKGLTKEPSGVAGTGIVKKHKLYDLIYAPGP